MQAGTITPESVGKAIAALWPDAPRGPRLAWASDWIAYAATWYLDPGRAKDFAVKKRYLSARQIKPWTVVEFELDPGDGKAPLHFSLPPARPPMRFYFCAEVVRTVLARLLNLPLKISVLGKGTKQSIEATVRLLDKLGAQGSASAESLEKCLLACPEIADRFVDALRPPSSLWTPPAKADESTEVARRMTATCCVGSSISPGPTPSPSA